MKYVLSLKEEDSAKLVMVFQEGQTRVYENKDVFPRAFMVYDYQVVRDKQEAINLLMSEKTDLAKVAILEELPTTRSDLVEGKNEIKIEDYRENRVIIDVKTDEAGILILTDSYYPGWKAKVDGEGAKIYRADYNFRAIMVSEGIHKVIFEYDWY